MIPAFYRPQRFYQAQRFNRQYSYKNLILLLSLASCCAVSAQPSLLREASDIDWIDYEDLTPEQQALVGDNCCGMYVEPPLPENPGESGSILLSADRSNAEDLNVFTLEGNIEIRRDDLRLSADSGTYNYDTGHASVQGNIRIRQPGMLLTGTDGTVENEGETGRLNNASYVLHNENVRGNAETITYTDIDRIITIDNGVYTRCEPGDDSWAVEGSRIILNQESGRGLARNVKLRVRDIPVFYLPLISFPINDERATGFLAPTIGSTRDGGLDFSAPYYLNLAPNYDATLTPRIMTDRGIMLGVEGRYRGRRQQNILQLNYLPGDNRFDADELLLPNPDSPPEKNRWLVSYDHVSRPAAGWSAVVDYTSVSDNDYFQDLGSTGLYTTTQSYLYRQGGVRWQNDNWRFRVAALGYQIIDPSVPVSSKPYKRLPKVNLDGSFISSNGFEYGLRSEYVNFDRDLQETDVSAAQLARGTLVTGQRFSLEPELSYPWSSPGAFLTPEVKYKLATYQLDDPGGVYDTKPSRGVFSGSLDGGLIFERELGEGNNSLIQTLEPRMFYLYNDYEDQSDIPIFDSSNMTFSFNQLFREDRFSGKDRIGDTSQLTLAVTTRFLNSAGSEKASASIGQIRYFRDRRVTLNNFPGEAQRTNSSAVAGEMTYQFNTNWRINSYLEWNPEDKNLDVGNFQFRYQSDINHILNFSYRFRDVPNPITASGLDRRIKQTDISVIWPLRSNWGLIARWNYDHANKRNLETIAGLEYNSCCYSIRVLARRWIDNGSLFFGNLENNTGIFLQFELKGFGSVLGGNVSGILNNGISGYREREYFQ